MFRINALLLYEGDIHKTRNKDAPLRKSGFLYYYVFKDVPVPTFPLFPQERPFIFQLGLSFYCKARIRTSISFSFFNPSFTSLIFVSP